MKMSFAKSAILAAVVFVPTSAFANYYSYERCLNGGGNWFSCLGELAWDDGSIASPDQVEEQFGFLRGQIKDGEDRIMETVKDLSQICDKKKGDQKTTCYQEGLKSKLGSK